MACTVWYCYSSGHWVKAKKGYFCTAPGHWSPAKAFSYKRTATAYQTCGTAIPTISAIAAITLHAYGAYTFRATIRNAVSIQWWYKYPGGAWVNWGAAHRAGLGNGTANSMKYNNFQVKVVAANQWGAKTSNVATLHVSLPPPKITRSPSSLTVARGGLAIFHVAGTGYTLIKWFTASPTGAWREITTANAFGWGRTQLTLRSLTTNGQRIKCILYNAANVATHSSVAVIHIR